MATEITPDYPGEKDSLYELEPAKTGKKQHNVYFYSDTIAVFDELAREHNERNKGNPNAKRLTGQKLLEISALQGQPEAKRRWVERQMARTKAREADAAAPQA